MLILFSQFFLVGGALVIIIGIIGLLRMPDLLTRVHATSIIDVLGSLMIIVGLLLHAGWQPASVKLILVLGCLFLTSPTITHLLVKITTHIKKGK